MLREEFRDLHCVLAMPFHSKVQRFGAGDGQKRVHRRHGRAVITQCDRARLGGECEVAKILVEAQPVIGRLRLGQRGELTARGPIEFAGFDDHSAHGIAVAAQELRCRMHDEIGAPLERPAEIG